MRSVLQRVARNMNLFLYFEDQILSWGEDSFLVLCHRHSSGLVQASENQLVFTSVQRNHSSSRCHHQTRHQACSCSSWELRALQVLKPFILGVNTNPTSNPAELQENLPGWSSSSLLQVQTQPLNRESKRAWGELRAATIRRYNVEAEQRRRLHAAWAMEPEEAVNLAGSRADLSLTASCSSTSTTATHCCCHGHRKHLRLETHRTTMYIRWIWR